MSATAQLYGDMVGGLAVISGRAEDSGLSTQRICEFTARRDPARHAGKALRRRSCGLIRKTATRSHPMKSSMQFWKTTWKNPIPRNKLPPSTGSILKSYAALSAWSIALEYKRQRGCTGPQDFSQGLRLRTPFPDRRQERSLMADGHRGVLEIPCVPRTARVLSKLSLPGAYPDFAVSC